MAGRLFVLVVTQDPRLEHQALAAVRAAGCLPMLGHADEDCAAALRRTLPDVVLIDALNPAATSPAFYEEAAALGAKVITLAPDARDGQAREIALSQNTLCVSLPTEYDLVSATLGLERLS
jgi:hypothetical protein